MENLVGKASDNLAEICNSQPSSGDNTLEFREDTSNDCENQENISRNSEDIKVKCSTGVHQTSTTYGSPVANNFNNQVNVGIIEGEQPPELQYLTHEGALLASQSAEKKDESLTINITSNHQNAIKETVKNFGDLHKNVHSSGNKQVGNSLHNNISDIRQDLEPQSSAGMSASLLHLSSYGSDSEADTEVGKAQNKAAKKHVTISEASKNKKNSAPDKEASDSLCNYVIFSGTSSEDSSSDSDTSDGKKSEKANVISNSACYRKSKESSNESETSSSDDSDNEDEAEEMSTSTTNAKLKQKTFEPPRVKGELTLDDLPPVPDLSTLKIDVKEEDCIQMGTISSIVDKLVMVQSLPDIPAYDVDTLLFLENGKRPLGHVYDVIGPVSCPMYAVRFNSRQEIDTKGIAKDLPVFSAPKTEHTQYVFLKELLRIKGSDASWQGDNEVPPEFVDFSDDEEEFSATNCTNDEYELYQNKRKRNSLERHRIFEMEMNQRNKLDSAYHRLRDSCEPKFKKTTNSNTHTTRTFNPFSNNLTYTQPSAPFVRPNQPTSFGILPQPQWSFVPTIPPPPAGFGMPPFFQNQLCQPFPGFANQVLAFPPLNVPPPCSAPPPVPPALPPMNIPPPVRQTIAQGIRPPMLAQGIKTLPLPNVQLSINRLPQNGNVCYTPQNAIVNGTQNVIMNGQKNSPSPRPNVQQPQNGRISNTQPQNASPNNTLPSTPSVLQTQNRNIPNAQIKPQSVSVPQTPGVSQAPGIIRSPQQSNVVPPSQSIPQPKSAPPVPHRLPVQSLPPTVRSVPPPPFGPPRTIATIPSFGMQPIFRPFPSCMQPPPPLPQTNATFRPSGNGMSVPKSQGTSQPCPMPYPPCLGLPKFTAPPPSSVTSSNGNGGSSQMAPGMPHFSGAMPFGHVAPPPPPPCSQNGRTRFSNFSSQNGCGYYRKQF